MELCELMSRLTNKPATNFFKEYFHLMNKYADYFFSQPWPKKVSYEAATTFTDEDLEFLTEKMEEYHDRFETMCLKKNIYVEGFMGHFGMFSTQQAFHEQFIRPTYKPVLEAFESFAPEPKDARDVVNTLKEKFEIELIHDSLIDLLRHSYPDKPKRKLIEEIFDLLHNEEGLDPCEESRCDWYSKQTHPESQEKN